MTTRCVTCNVERLLNFRGELCRKMNPKVRTMLEGMYAAFEKEFEDRYTAWDRFVEFVAADNRGELILMFCNDLSWLKDKKTLTDRIIKIYDPALLKSDYYDHLGSIYLEKFVSKIYARHTGQFLTPMGLAKALADMNVPDTNEEINILDPAVGSARLLMAAHKRAPNACLFGVDIDLRMLRIAYTNFCIHNISGLLLHADSLKHEIDISTNDGLYNWKHANSWISQIDELREMSPERREEASREYFKKFQADLFIK